MDVGKPIKPLNTFLNYPTLAGLLCGLLIGLAIAVALQFRAEQKLLQQQDQQYGKALVTLAARQAIDATLNHDLVSLQVILRDITQNPRVANATIHDVENHLLVQAGTTPNSLRADTLTFTAPIIFHDSIAGYLALAISPNEHAPMSKGLLSLLVLVFGGLIAALYQSQHSDNPAPAKPAPLPIVDMPVKLEQPSHKSLHHVELDIQLLNLSRLERQLNYNRMSGLLDQFGRDLKRVLHLYKGENLGFIGSDCLRIRFSNRDLQTARLNAICTATLLTRQQDEQEGLHLQISTILTPSPLLLDIQQQQYLAQQRLQLDLNAVAIGTCLLHTDLCQEDEASLPFTHHPLNQDWTAITGLTPVYDELLGKQLHQLRQLVDS